MAIALTQIQKPFSVTPTHIEIFGNSVKTGKVLDFSLFLDNPPPTVRLWTCGAMGNQRQNVTLDIPFPTAEEAIAFIQQVLSVQKASFTLKGLTMASKIYQDEKTGFWRGKTIFHLPPEERFRFTKIIKPVFFPDLAAEEEADGDIVLFTPPVPTEEEAVALLRMPLQQFTSLFRNEIKHLLDYIHYQISETNILKREFVSGPSPEGHPRTDIDTGSGYYTCSPLSPSTEQNIKQCEKKRAKVCAAMQEIIKAVPRLTETFEKIIKHLNQLPLTTSVELETAKNFASYAFPDVPNLEYHEVQTIQAIITKYQPRKK